MGEVSTIEGLDIAKSVFQVHGVDVDGAVVIRKRIQPCEGFGVLCGSGAITWWVLRRVRVHIVGAASFKRSIIR